MFSIQMLLHFSQIARRVCTLVLFIVYIYDFIRFARGNYVSRIIIIIIIIIYIFFTTMEIFFVDIQYNSKKIIMQ